MKGGWARLPGYPPPFLHFPSIFIEKDMFSVALQDKPVIKCSIPSVWEFFETGITVWNHRPPSEGWRGGDSWTNDGATSPWVRLPGHGNPHIANAFSGIKCQINTAPQLLPCECVSSPAGSRCHVLFTWCGGQKLYLSGVFQIPRSNPGQQGHCNIWISLRVLIGHDLLRLTLCSQMLQETVRLGLQARRSPFHGHRKVLGSDLLSHGLLCVWGKPSFKLKPVERGEGPETSSYQPHLERSYGNRK